MVEDERSMGLQPFDQQPSNGHKRSNLDTIHTPRHRRAWQENVHGGNSSSVGSNASCMIDQRDPLNGCHFLPFTSPAVLVSLNSPSLPTLGIGGKERRVGGVYGGHGFYG
ncbi:hypothetical protein NC653_027962 [Populus alba x Populus x berolinensis]|uniref:Uncharacterized protein n=1 Tax=Populus alba x Populus x berolinensis TaxID=444605 RepID=A0AAD6M6U4_9ROSI|nr:hypothetical protein NC653_027962 [Populus alba x Populus x berolinensis]